MSALSNTQIEQFRRNGFLVVEDAVDVVSLQAMVTDFASWVEQSRDYSEAYGQTLDGRPRFDLDPTHSGDAPKLRRVNAPIEQSDAFFNAMKNSRMTECVAQLIGPNVKLHHTKINAKQPGSQTEVKWHQDFPFTPHSNDDLITALLMVDEVTLENGPLEVVPGSHHGDLESHWREDKFVGAVADNVAQECRRKAVSCIGSAGSVCLMHTRLLHGSAANLSKQPRTLFICVYSAEDAIPLSTNPVPSKYEGLLVAGCSTGQVRCSPNELRLPEKPKTASFFDQQAG